MGIVSVSAHTEMQITVILSGGDWSDAAVDYLVLPEGMDIGKENDAYHKWKREKWGPSYREGKPIKYMSFVDWCLSRGARIPSDDELFVFVEP